MTPNRIGQESNTKPRLSAACARGDHARCIVRNCTCRVCHPRNREGLRFSDIQRITDKVVK